MANIEGISKNKDLIFNCLETSVLHSFSSLPIVVLYDKPLDYPDNYVARLWDKDKPTKAIVLKDSLEELRKAIPEYMVRMNISSADDKKIIETYI